MRKAIALALGMLLPILGLAEVGLAQSAVNVQGVIQSVDCQSQTVVLSGGSGSNTLAASEATAVLVNSTSVPFCALGQYVGDPATAWLLPSGTEFQVTRIDVAGPAAAAPPALAASTPSTGTLILGALAIGAIGYILGHSSATQPVSEFGNGRWGQVGWHRSYQQCETRGRHQVCWSSTDGSRHR
ncbi:MAG TPA: hypothetical protein VGA35_05015 [bacterium]